MFSSTSAISLINPNGYIQQTWRSLSSGRGITFNPYGTFFAISLTSVYSINSLGTLSSSLFTSSQPNGIGFDNLGQQWLSDSTNGFIYRVLLTCTTPTPPFNGQAGTCISNMNYNTTCQFICNSGYTLTGTSTVCLGGQVPPQTCLSSTSSCSLTAPVNGQLTGCTSPLSSSSSCISLCNSGYQSQGQFTCSGGILTQTQTCILLGTGVNTWYAYPGFTLSTLGSQITIDGNNNIFSFVYYTTTTSANNEVYKIPSGQVYGTVFANGFNGPRGIAADINTNNIYVSNNNGNYISKITPSGSLTLQWVTGIPLPAQLAIDSNSNIYVISISTFYIYKLSSSGFVFTPQWGNVQFPSATISSGITIDSNNYLYFSSSPSGNIIVRISPNGLVQTNWVNSALGLTNLYPRGLEWNPFSSLINFISGFNNEIYSITGTGNSLGSLAYIYSSFNTPQGLIYDTNGALWVADIGTNYNIYRILLTCSVPSAPLNGQLGTCTTGMNWNSTCQFVCNSGYQLTGSSTICLGGNIIPQTCISSSSSCSITAPWFGLITGCSALLPSGSSCIATCNSGYQSLGQFTCAGGVLTQTQTCSFIGVSYYYNNNNLLGWNTGSITPYTIVVDNSTNVYISSVFTSSSTSSSNLIYKYNSTTASVTVFASGFYNNIGFISIDPISNNIYVPNYGGGYISRVTITGTNTLNWVSPITNPATSVVDWLGNVYVLSSSSFTIYKWTSAGVLISNNWAGQLFSSATTQGGMACDTLNNIYLVSTPGSTNIAKISPAGIVTLVWSNSVNFLRGISFSPNGLLTVTSYSNSALDSLSSNGASPISIFTSAATPTSVFYDSVGTVWLLNNSPFLYRIYFTCSQPTIPLNGTLGTCTTSMNEGTSCQFTCNIGYQLTGSATVCLGGNLIQQTCISSTSYCIMNAPLNGQLTGCPSLLSSGSSCIATCNSGYQSLGQFTCSGGNFTSSQSCSLLQTSYSIWMTGAPVNQITGLAVDFNNYIYLLVWASNTPSVSNILYRIIPTISYIGTSFTNGFSSPSAVSTDPNTGVIYVSNYVSSGFISRVTQGGTTNLNWFTNIPLPGSSVVDSYSNLYVWTGTYGYIYKITSAGQIVSNFFGGQAFLTNCNWQSGMTIDSNNNIYIVSLNNSPGQISIISPIGEVQLAYRSGSIVNPRGIALNSLSLIFTSTVSSPAIIFIFFYWCIIILVIYFGYYPRFYCHRSNWCVMDE